MEYFENNFTAPPNSDNIVMWRFLHNRRLILRLHMPTIFRALTYWAHREVILAIAWFSCFSLWWVGWGWVGSVKTDPCLTLLSRMHLQSPMIDGDSVKSYPDIKLFWRGRHNKNNKMSSDVRSVPDLKNTQNIIKQYRQWSYRRNEVKNNRRNRELTALLYVFCSFGCWWTTLASGAQR